MILRNKLTKESLDISYSEFRKKFAKELNKPAYNFKDDNSVGFNLYLELHWNFNNFVNSNWYIKRI